MINIYFDKNNRKYVGLFEGILFKAKTQNYPKIISFELNTLMSLLETKKQDDFEVLKDCLDWLMKINIGVKVTGRGFDKIIGGHFVSGYTFDFEDNYVEIRFSENLTDFLPLLQIVYSSDGDDNA